MYFFTPLWTVYEIRNMPSKIKVMNKKKKPTRAYPELGF